MFSNPIRLMLISSGLLAGVILWRANANLQTNNTLLQQTIMTIEAERDILYTSLQQQRGQIDALLQVNRLQAAYSAELQMRLQASRDLATRRLTTLDALTHDQSENQHWGDTRLPDDIARLLDFTHRQPNPNSGAVVPERDTVPLTQRATDHQPAAGAKSDRASASAGSLRGTSGTDRTVSERNAA
ncbi:hypothetical protein [Chitinivorax sp. B]|uniref:hypothetical protein n=1 Tax=Chitinivorax sp. B TaxID=2502235 RepID=UPI0010F45880|nr:hypothetical protein [Chitinivorax sp. B]